MKKFKIFILVLTIISFGLCGYNVIDGVQKREWIVTYATIDRIGLPDGAVFGTYEDQNGIIHSSEELYLSHFLQGYDIQSGKYIGDKIKIIYNPQTGKVINYRKIIFSRCISVVLQGISVLSFILLKKKIKNYKY